MITIVMQKCKKTKNCLHPLFDIEPPDLAR